MMLTGVLQKNGSMVKCAGKYLIKLSVHYLATLNFWFADMHCPVEIILNSYQLFKELVCSIQQNFGNVTLKILTLLGFYIFMMEEI